MSLGLNNFLLAGILVPIIALFVAVVFLFKRNSKISDAEDNKRDLSQNNSGTSASASESESQSDNKNQCVLCSETEELLRCSRCKSVWYCGTKHQSEHWPSHRKNCKRKHKHKREPVKYHTKTQTQTSTQPQTNPPPIPSAFSATQKADPEFPDPEPEPEPDPEPYIVKKAKNAGCTQCGGRRNLLRCSKCKATWFCEAHRYLYSIHQKYQCRQMLQQPFAAYEDEDEETASEIIETIGILTLDESQRELFLCGFIRRACVCNTNANTIMPRAVWTIVVSYANDHSFVWDQTQHGSEVVFVSPQRVKYTDRERFQCVVGNRAIDPSKYGKYDWQMKVVGLGEGQEGDYYAMFGFVDAPARESISDWHWQLGRGQNSEDVTRGMAFEGRGKIFAFGRGGPHRATLPFSFVPKVGDVVKCELISTRVAFYLNDIRLTDGGSYPWTWEYFMYVDGPIVPAVVLYNAEIELISCNWVEWQLEEAK